jgi:hypothetical protein
VVDGVDSQGFPAILIVKVSALGVEMLHKLQSGCSGRCSTGCQKGTNEIGCTVPGGGIC